MAVASAVASLLVPTSAPLSRRSRQAPILNRATAHNWFGYAKACLAFARVRREAGYPDGAAFYVVKAREAHRRGLTCRRRLLAQGGERT